jgi:hypothetical protein
LVAEIGTLAITGAQVIPIVHVWKAADRRDVDLTVGALEESVADLSALASERRGIVVNALVEAVARTVAVDVIRTQSRVITRRVKAIGRPEVRRTAAVSE